MNHVIEIIIEGLKLVFGQASSIKVETKCFQNRARYHEPTNDRVKKVLLMTAPTESVSIIIPLAIPELGIKDSWIKASGSGRMELDPKLSKVIEAHNQKTRTEWFQQMLGEVANTTKVNERKAMVAKVEEPMALVLDADKVWYHLTLGLKADTTGETLSKIVQVKEVKEEKKPESKADEKGDLDRGLEF